MDWFQILAAVNNAPVDMTDTVLSHQSKRKIVFLGDPQPCSAAVTQWVECMHRLHEALVSGYITT